MPSYPPPPRPMLTYIHPAASVSVLWAVDVWQYAAETKSGRPLTPVSLMTYFETQISSHQRELWMIVEAEAFQSPGSGGEAHREAVPTTRGPRGKCIPALVDLGSNATNTTQAGTHQSPQSCGPLGLLDAMSHSLCNHRGDLWRKGRERPLSLDAPAKILGTIGKGGGDLPALTQGCWKASINMNRQVRDGTEKRPTDLIDLRLLLMDHWISS